jgi:hypothetical protein
MESTDFPHRCPKCNALVVDRRSPVCTSCRTALPAAWIMTAEQTAKTNELDRQMKATHAAEMKMLDPNLDPDVPPVLRILDIQSGGHSLGGF